VASRDRGDLAAQKGDEPNARLQASLDRSEGSPARVNGLPAFDTINPCSQQHLRYGPPFGLVCPLVEVTKVRPCGGARIIIFGTTYSTAGARGVSATTSATHSPTRQTRKL